MTDVIIVKGHLLVLIILIIIVLIVAKKIHDTEFIFTISEETLREVKDKNE